jgi:cyanophycinase
MRTGLPGTALLLAACGGSSAVPVADVGTSIIDDAPVESAPPLPPAALTHWVTGNAADKVAVSTAGIVLMGGGTDVDAAFAWQRDRIGGGDVVVLRASGADGYNDYLYTDIGGVDSVETLLVNTRALAMDPYVRWTIDHAEAIFLAGGDQAVYVAMWKGTPVSEALTNAWGRGAVVGGTSAGCAFASGIVYSASAGTVLSSEALGDPYDSRVTLDRDVLDLAPLANVIADTHFAQRDRMGRLVAFAARAIADGWTTAPVALGVDEKTALLVDPAGTGTVVGTGAVYAITAQQAPAQCAAGQSLEWSGLPLHELRAGDTISLPSGATAVAPRTLGASGGALTPSNPY